MDQDARERRERLAEREPTLSEYGSPLFVFFEADLRRNYRALRGALDDHYPDSRVHFAAKANFNLGVLSVLADEGCGAEAYSGCELSATRRAGFDPGDTILTGMNRDAAAIERALAAGVGHLLVDNAAELDRIEAAASATGTVPRVLLRGNPAIEVPTHPDVATATRESKFGLDIDSGRAMAVAERIADSDRVELAGVQLHIGSQIRGVEPYAVATRAMLDFAADIRDDLGVEIDVLDMGGGLPVRYDEAVPETDAIVEAIAAAVEASCAEHGLSRPRLFLEPGRRLVGTAGALVGTVGAVKETPAGAFAVLDVGTNAVGSHWQYPIYALDGGEPARTYDVAGPLCYTGDVIREDVALPELGVGDRLVVDRVGAYSLGSASHTNATPKPPVVLVREGGGVDLVRPGETCADVIGDDRVPDDLR
ncbi:diaminopimelate decarboxylase [Halosimplex marinum]|uniref:diaminopimelate decarboxylase n=1 Tax=Halosimplex marinum TaxID=3396620 RepID=UPI003F576BF8